MYKLNVLFKPLFFKLLFSLIFLISSVIGKAQIVQPSIETKVTSSLPVLADCDCIEITLTVQNNNTFVDQLDVRLNFPLGFFTLLEVPAGFAPTTTPVINASLNEGISFEPFEVKEFVFKGQASAVPTSAALVISGGVNRASTPVIFDEIVQDVPVTTVIDGTVSPASLNSLIAQEVLITANESCSEDPMPSPQFQNLHIKGVLNVDTDYCFKANENIPDITKTFVYMDEGAEVVVKAGATLTIDRKRIRGCSKMWKSITVEDGGVLIVENATIEDAQYGILAKDGATIIVNSTVFKNNYVGIQTPKAVNNTQNNINFNLFYGNSFTSDAPLKLPYAGQVPTPEAIPFAGMVLNNVSFAGLNLTPLAKTTFSHLANGIVARSSNLSLGNVDFRDIHLLDDTTYPHSGRGIFATANSLFHTLIHSNNTFGDSEYENCDIGILAQGINVTLRDLTMSKVRTGIQLEQNNGRILRVNDNTINATHLGIFLNDNSFNYVSEVKNNIISIQNPTDNGVAGIKGTDMINIIDDGFGWDIENNLVQIGEAAYGVGIYYEMGSFNNFIGNSISTSLGEYDSHVGYLIEGGSDNRVLCNSFTGNASSSTLNGNPSIGYDLDGAVKTDISCNEGHDTDIGIRIFGSSDNSKVRGNNIWDAGTGLQIGKDESFGLGNVVIGEQLHNGNIWEIDNNPNDDNYGAVHYGHDPDLILLSKFEVDNSINPPLANRTFLPSYNTPNFSGVSWFDVQNNVTYSCSIANTCPEGIGWHGFVDGGGITKLDEKIAQGNLASDGYDQAMNWTGKRHLFQKMVATGYDASTINTPTDLILANFYTNESNTSVGQFNTFDRGVNDLFTLDASTEANMLSQRADLDIKINTLIQLEEDIQGNQFTGNDLVVKLQEKSTILNELHGLDESGMGFSAQVKSQQETALEDLLIYNATITANDIYETNEKAFNELYLSKKLNEDKPYSEEEINTIEAIANQCPLSGGDAVYKARAMMASIAPDQTFDDINLCQLDQKSQRIGASTKQNVLNLAIYPNPTADIIEVRITSDNSQEDDISSFQIFIYNFTGQKMMEESIQYNEQKTYDLSSYDAGVYTVLIRNKDGVLLRSSKVTVMSH